MAGTPPAVTGGVWIACRFAAGDDPDSTRRKKRMRPSVLNPLFASVAALADVVPGSLVTVAVRIERHRPPPPHRSRSPYLIYASDDTGDLVITYFNMQRSYLQRLLPVGELRYVSGTTDLYDGMLQMVHPDRVVDEKGLADLPRIEPVYPLTEGLAHGPVYRAVEAALAKLPPVPEWQD